MIEVEIPDFEKFCEKIGGISLQPWQRQLVKMIIERKNQMIPHGRIIPRFEERVYLRSLFIGGDYDKHGKRRKKKGKKP